LNIRSKPKKRCRELEDDSHSQINAKRVARSSAGTKPKKRRNSNSDIYATCEPEDAASQTSSKSARSSLGTKPNDTPDQASTTKAIRLNFTSRPRKHDAKTKRATRDMSNSGRKQSISTPGACHPRSESDRQNDDDDDDSVPEQPPKKRHAQTRRSTRNTLNSGGRQSLENTSGKRHQPSEFDDGNKDDNNNLNQHCDSFDQDRQRLGTQSRRLTLKIPSKSRPSSEMKLIDEDNG
jgi:hypothetical protein